MTGVDNFELVLVLLTAAVLLSTLAPTLRLPPASVFVLGGMALALIPGTPAVTIDPDLVLVLFLPPLLATSAWDTSWRDFRADFGPILILAIGAVLFTTATVGWAAKLLAPDLPWMACFTLGAIVSPPDAVAAKAVLQRLPLPRRLVTVLEGESLINDASGLVLYRFAAAAALSGTFSPGWAAAGFAWVAAGGVAIGLAAGLLADIVFRRMRHPHHITISSFLLSYASYIAAERVHASGVLAVVCCGLVLGWRQHATISAEVRLQASAVWRLVTFALEALVFVLIGLSLRGVIDRLGAGSTALEIALPLTAGVTAAAIVSRFALVFPSVYLISFLSGARARTPPLAVPLIISWAGMRGVVSLAAVLALPEHFPGRDRLLLATFGVILVTVLLQGTTLGPLARWLGLSVRTEPGQDGALLSTDAARAHVMVAAASWLETVKDETGEPAHPNLLRDWRRRADITVRFLTETEQLRPQRDEHFAMALRTIDQGRSALLALHREGRIHDSALHVIEGELDHEEMHLRQLSHVPRRR